MTIEEAVKIITSSSGGPAFATSEQFRVAKDLAIDALLSVQRVRSTCGACLPYHLLGETLPDEEFEELK